MVMRYRCPICGKRKHRQSKVCRRCFLASQRTPEYRAAMAAKRKGKSSYYRTQSHRKAMSDKLKGVPKRSGWKHSAETKSKIASAWTLEMREQFRQRGLKLAQDPKWRAKVSSFGDSNPMWRGGCGGKYTPGFDASLKRAIRKRDNFTCQLCGITENESGYIHSVHHIDYSHNNHKPDNLVTTCKGCNSRVNTNESVWFSYFTALAEMRCKLGKNILNLIGRKIISQRNGFVTLAHN